MFTRTCKISSHPSANLLLKLSLKVLGVKRADFQLNNGNVTELWYTKASLKESEDMHMQSGILKSFSGTAVGQCTLMIIFMR